jgi:superfamily II DNA or RNA helicase
MLPSAALEYEFTGNVRMRGAEYARRGAVELLSAGEAAVLAIVRGSSTYVTTISRVQERRETRFEMSCSCPYVLDRWEPCKHLWATLREAEQRGHLGGANGASAGPGTAYIQILEPAEDLDGQLEDRMDALTGRASSRTEAPAARRPSRHEAALGAFLDAVEHGLADVEAPPLAPFPVPEPEVRYVIDVPATQRDQAVVLHLMRQRTKKNGTLSAPKTVTLSTADIAAAPLADRRFLARLTGSTRVTAYPGWYGAAMRQTASFQLTIALALDLLPEIAQAGRLWIRTRPDVPDLTPLTWDDGPAWGFRAIVTTTPEGFHVAGEFYRGDDTATPVEPALLLEGLIALRGTLARFEIGPERALLAGLSRSGPIDVPADAAPVLAQTLARCGTHPERLPEPLRIAAVRGEPRPRLSVTQPSTAQSGRLEGRLAFDYDGSIVPGPAAVATAFDAARQRLIHRRLDLEALAAQRLVALGLVAAQRDLEPVFSLHAGTLPFVVRTLVTEGWHVEANGARYRPSTAVRLSVSSGIDWFDLTTTVEFGATSAGAAEILEALKTGAATVRLGDGTIGILPEDWLRRYAPLAAAGQLADDRIRFGRPQALLLDALLASRKADAAVSVDRTFETVRRELDTFSTIAPLDPPATFVGTLRPYQREGLGWFAFLRRFGFGGCLADDMGLGKTVMVLALIESRRLGAARDGRPTPPSLVVVPRSLIGNWMAEAATFTPALRVLDHSHGSRAWTEAALAGYDLVLATYGTLRRDIGAIDQLTFDYVVLDEAQAIKNAGTAGAKAARLLRAAHRLALSGTPVENHLGELWSLFEFLNPGVLGRSSVFQRAIAAAGGPDDSVGDAAAVLSRGLRPFILRRTKQQVARELPARTEQTISCELSQKERSLYDGLRRHYRDALLGRIERHGLAKAKLQVLEALLRLRQAACHPGLVDREKRSGGSAKFDVLLPRLREVVDEGHKALVFSQFTTLLGLLRDALDAEGLVYEYLDGNTKDRQARVRRFQDDSAVGLFLISLKAGGVGLNLTAAEYVFLLDPWWNPAVEAQAIDRTHRIGQTREVFAYRLIAKDTVEEKVLALQQSKRALADAVLSADAVGLRHLQREDLELLLS